MPWGRVANFAGLLCIALALSSCGYRSEEFSYRMTVEVDTPEGPRSGESVIEVGLHEPGESRFLLPDAAGSQTLRGEAVAVDLPGGKVLFALLQAPGDVDAAGSFPIHAFNPKLYPGEYAFIRRAQELKKVRSVGVLPRESYPFLVTFGDPADPTSIQRLDPDNLAAVFGEGVKLRRITIEMTDDTVTSGISDRLPWLGTINDQSYQAADFPKDIPLGNFTGLFVKGGE